MPRAILIDGYDAETGIWQPVTVAVSDVPDTVRQVRAALNDFRVWGGAATWYGGVRGGVAPTMPPMDWSHPVQDVETIQVPGFRLDEEP